MCVSHHQSNLLTRRQSPQQIAGQLVAEDAGLAQAALQSLLVLLTGVRAAPRSLKHAVDDAHHVPTQTALQSRCQRVILQLHLHTHINTRQRSSSASVSVMSELV